MKRTVLILLLLLLPAAASAGPAEAKRFLIHVKTPLKHGDALTAFIPRLALEAVQRGYRTAILFDDDGVDAIRIGSWYGGHTTSLDKAYLSEEELASLAALLAVPPGTLPDNYGDLLRFLKGKGVELYASKAALDSRDIGGERYDHAVEVLAAGGMLELFERAAVTVSY